MSLRVKTIVGCRKFALVCFFISVLLTLLGMLLRALPLTVAGLVMITAAVITSLLFWRCPNCKKLLPMRINKKDVNNDIDGFYTCPYCNKKFSGNDK